MSRVFEFWGHAGHLFPASWAPSVENLDQMPLADACFGAEHYLRSSDFSHLIILKYVEMSVCSELMHYGALVLELLFHRFKFPSLFWLQYFPNYFVRKLLFILKEHCGNIPIILKEI